MKLELNKYNPLPRIVDELNKLQFIGFEGKEVVLRELAKAGIVPETPEDELLLFSEILNLTKDYVK